MKDLQPVLWDRWGFSMGLAVGYLALFHVWIFLSPEWVKATGVMGGVLFMGLGWAVWRKGYFLDQLDLWAHGMVVLDILFEALLIPEHSGYGFYGCAIGFAVVCGGYRWALIRRLSELN